jgi:hypothetical protein
MGSDMYVHGATEDAQQDLSQNNHWKLAAASRSVLDLEWYAKLGRKLKLQWRHRLLRVMPKY